MSDPLFAPFTIKKLTLRNRIVSTSHEPAYGEDGLPKDRYRAYHREKARGGVASDDDGRQRVGQPRQHAAVRESPAVPGRGRALPQGAQ